VLEMTTGVDEFDNKIRDLAEREKECDDLFDEIKAGNGEQSVRYIELRDSCNDLRRELFKRAKTAGLTREVVKKEMTEAKNWPRPRSAETPDQ
jgi:hypothetical protein